jgi:hypothetical protein
VLARGRGGRTEARPFPLRLALRPEVADALGLPADARIFPRLRFPAKRLYPLHPTQVSGPLPVAAVLLGRRGAGDPEVRPLPRVRAFLELAAVLTLGRGLPQMAELLVRLDAVPALARIALSRLRLAWRLSREAPVLRLTLGMDARRNAEFLADWRPPAGPAGGDR